MRFKLRHKLTFDFAEPVRGLTQILRLTPRSHDGQRVQNWRIDVEPDCLLKAGEDHFGNLTHTLTVPGVVDRLAITVHGEIASFDAAGIIRGSAERLPAELYLRGTRLTTAEQAVRSFADDATSSAKDPISKLHSLMGALHDAVAFDPTTTEQQSVDEVLHNARGNAHDQAHVFIACARHLGWPARCVTGYYAPEEEAGRRHTWAEVQVEGLGWVGFDPVLDVCPQDSHLRMALGLDALDAAALRGTRLDGLSETLDVTWLFKRETSIVDGQNQAQSTR